MQPCRHGIADLLPHRPPMLLLDEMLAYDATAARASTTIRETSLFLDGAAVPVHIGLEYMAQACGAHAGALARDRGEPVKIGFLLGTRQYRAYVPCFRIGERLIVTVSVTYLDGEMGAFDCRIEIGGNLAAEAQLTVYQPDPAQLAMQAGESAP